DVQNHRKTGMTNAMHRLNKDYMYEKRSGALDLLIRPFHYMEAKKAATGGKHKTLVKITDNNHGSWNSLGEASYRSGCYKEEPGGWGGGDVDGDAIKDTDGKTYKPLANHHEMGHATGCFDDYLYKLKITDASDGKQKTVFVPRFSPQHIEGGPYSCDDIARMKSNRTARLRNYWKYACWLHDKSKAADGVNPEGDLYKFFKGTKFKVTYKGKKNATEFKHEFALKDAYKNITKPHKKKTGLEIVINKGTPDEKRSLVDLFLYKCGDDEFSHFKNLGKMVAGYETTQVYHGILCIRHMLAVRFDGGWSFNAKKSWLQRVDHFFGDMLHGKFNLESAHPDFRKMYVFAVPHFKEYSGAAPGDSNANIVVKWSAGTGFTRPDAKTISMDRGNNAQQTGQIKRIIRCCFAHSHGATDTADLDKDDFPSIVSWVKTELGNVATVLMDI
ncbi:MAG: hypothetical protein KJO91_07270, partial [Gammaproteobacteria bacterium]|nr:hypothetical protein [Gammaproteobacteria bacterium]